MSKFWSPTGSNEMDDVRYRLSAIRAMSAFHGVHWLSIEFIGRSISVYYPTLEARDADYTQLLAALEAE